MGLVAVVLSLGLVATACNGGGSKDRTVTIGWIPWNEDVAVTYLWKYILEERGYKVRLVQLPTGNIFSGVSKGDVDVFLDMWLPITHKDYWKLYGGQLEKLGTWYEQATLNIAVPEYAPINSLTQLSEHAERYEGTILGIEPDAGLTSITTNRVIPEYNLEAGFELKTSSTASMLSALESALEEEEPIAVTLWHPHFAYAKYDIKDLADPENALGATEKLYSVARTGFNEDYPRVASWLKNFELTDQQLANLERLMFSKYKNQEEKAVQVWLEDHQNLVEQWTGSGKPATEHSPG